MDNSQLHQGQADIGALMHELLRAQDAAARLRYQLVETESRLRDASARIDQLEGSIAFGIGAAQIRAVRSLRGLAELPASLLRLFRRRKSDGGAGPASQARIVDEAPASPSGASPTAAYFSRRRQPARTLRDLRLGVVMDRFTLACFQPECALLELRNQGFEDELTAFMPHMLVVESAWRGCDGTWRDRIHPASADLRYLVDCCNRRGIPTVFWNKEDPAHFDHFIDAAKLFDHVFTTDADCIGRYRQALGHERVHLLMFGCQPRLHHPVERFERRLAASFAGSWYHQYPSRCRDFDEVMQGIGSLLPVDIYDRNADRGDPRFEFPPRYRPLVRGSLAYDEIDRAYKGYDFSVNINTITHSSSMLARRVHELMASNTLVISNASKALSSTFDGLVISGDAAGIAERLRPLVEDRHARHRLRLRALRTVLGAHTCAHRVDTLASVVLQQPMGVPRAAVVVLAEAADAVAARALIDAFERQSWPAKHLFMVAADEVAAQLSGDNLSVISPEAAARLVPEREWGGRWLAPWHAGDHYGDNYLTDLALATGWIDALAVGKGRRYRWTGAAVQLTEGEIYAENQPLWLRSSLLRADALGDCSLAAWMERLRTQAAPDLVGLAVDEFNYCVDGRGHPTTTVDVD